MKERIRILDQEIKDKTAERDRLIKEHTDSCLHLEVYIVEGRYTDYARPFRVCRMCGYAEEGWGSGYWKLKTKDEVPELGRDAAWKFVRRFLDQGEQSRLRRGS